MPAAVAEPRVLHLPSQHPYVDHVTTPPAGRPRSWPQPGPVDGSPWGEGPGWVVRHRDRFDVLHVHFGFEGCPLARFRAVLEAARDAGTPVVWTAHDLTNPHLVDQSHHEAQLALLAEHASVVLTLTPGAADDLADRHGRRAVVVRHPHLAPTAVLAAGHRDPAGTDEGGPLVVGLQLGSLRPSTDPAVVAALLQVVADRGDTVLRVRLREEVLDEGFPRPDADLLAGLRAGQRAGHVDLRLAGRVTEDDLWRELAELDALVLPYRWGTHSGWVEACTDVGTPVVAPVLGRWGEQQPLHGFPVTGGRPSADGLAAALAAALDAGPAREPVLHRRLREREATVATHDRLHRSAAAGERR